MTTYSATNYSNRGEERSHIRGNMEMIALAAQVKPTKAVQWQNQKRLPALLSHNFKLKRLAEQKNAIVEAARIKPNGVRICNVRAHGAGRCYLLGTGLIVKSCEVIETAKKHGYNGIRRGNKITKI